MRINDVLLNNALNFRLAASDPGLIKPAGAVNNTRNVNSQDGRNLNRSNFENVFDDIVQTTSSINVARAIQGPFSAGGTAPLSNTSLTTELFPQLHSGTQALSANTLLNAFGLFPEFSIFQFQFNKDITELTDTELQAHQLDLQNRLFSMVLLEETFLLTSFTTTTTNATDFFSLFTPDIPPIFGFEEEFQTVFPFDLQLSSLSPFGSGIRLIDIQREIQDVINQLLEIDKLRILGPVESQQAQSTNSNEVPTGSSLDVVV